MDEHITQMVPMLIVGGLVAAWLAEAISRDGGYGFSRDTLVGLVGSLVTGGFVWLVVSRETWMTTMLGAGCAGGGLAIVLQRTLWRSSRGKVA
jgi:uncharacterized membrane protein YeaQ/YmgE (transglycosylase-associated protein family)